MNGVRLRFWYRAEPPSTLCFSQTDEKKQQDTRMHSYTRPRLTVGLAGKKDCGAAFGLQRFEKRVESVYVSLHISAICFSYVSVYCRKAFCSHSFLILPTVCIFWCAVWYILSNAEECSRAVSVQFQIKLSIKCASLSLIRFLMISQTAMSD